MCEFGETVTFDMLCDGRKDCSGGDDEVTTLCYGKPYVVASS